MSQKSSTTSTDILGKQTIGQLLWQYSLPAIIASLATSLYNIVDSIFIGRGVGAMAITGLAITFPLMNLVVAFCVLVAVGGATISSIFLGQKNQEKASMVVGNVTILCLVHSVFIMAVGLAFLDPILFFFGATDETIGYAREFMFIIILGTPVSYVFLGLNNLMRATGYPRKAMVSALLSVAVNIVAAPIMIFVLDWGIAGAAIATIMGQFGAFIWVLWHFLSKNSYIHFTRRCWKLSGELIKRMYSIGLSPFLMNCCACLVVVFINKALLENAGADGNLAVGAYGIINRTTMFFVMIIFGITQGMQPILGYNYGAGLHGRLRRCYWLATAVATAVVTTGCAFGLIWPDLIARAFTTDAELIAVTSRAMSLALLAFWMVGFQIVSTTFFQSIGKAGKSIFLSLTRQVIFLIPLLLTLPGMLGLDGIWLSFPTSDVLATVVTALLIAWQLRRLPAAASR